MSCLLARRLSRARRARDFWKAVRGKIQCDDLETRDDEVFGQYQDNVTREALDGTDDPPCWKYRDVGCQAGRYSYSVCENAERWVQRAAEDWCASCKRRQKAHELFKRWRARASARLAAITRLTPARPVPLSSLMPEESRS